MSESVKRVSQLTPTDGRTDGLTKKSLPSGDISPVRYARTTDKACPSTNPEPHFLGEFPMTCYRCHVEADS